MAAVTVTDARKPLAHLKKEGAMTAPKHLLSAKSHANDECVIVFGTLFSEMSFTLLGSSMPTNATAGSPGLHQLAIFPKSQVDGVIAISVTRMVLGKREETVFHYPFFIYVKWKDGKPIAELDESWVSHKIISCVTRSGIEVVLPKDRRVSSTPFREPNTTKVSLVPDADLLCRYLVGTATLREVRQAMIKEKVEKSAPKRIESLTRKLRIATARSSYVEGICDTLTDEIRKKSADASAFAALLLKFMQTTDSKWFRRLVPWFAVSMLRDLLSGKFATSDGVTYQERLLRYKIREEMETGRVEKEPHVQSVRSY